MPKGNPLYQVVKTLNLKEKKNVKEAINTSPFKDKDKNNIHLLLKYILSILETIDLSSISSDYLKSEAFNKKIYQKVCNLHNKKDKEIDKKFPYWKTYLLEIIMQTLRENNFSSKNKFKKIQIAIENANIFITKGLDNLAVAELKKARRLAKNEDWVSFLNAGIQLRTIMQEFESNTKNIQLSIAEDEKALSFLQLEMDLFKIHEELYFKNQNTLHLETSFFQQMPHLVYNKLGIYSSDPKQQVAQLIEKTSNLSTNIIFYAFFSLYSYYSQDQKTIKLGVSILQTMLSIIEERPNFKITYQSRYLNLLNNLFNGYYYKKEIKKMEEIIHKVEHLPNIKKKLIYKRLQHLHYYKMLYFSFQKKYDEIIELEKEILQVWDKYKKILPIARKMVFSYNLACTFLIKEKYKKTQFWCEQIIEDSNRKIRPNLRYRAKLLVIINLFNQDLNNQSTTNEFIIEYKSKNLIRTLRQKKNEEKNLLTIIGFIRPIFSAQISKRKEVIKTTLTETMNDVQLMQSYKEIIAWLQAVNGEDYR